MYMFIIIFFFQNKTQNILDILDVGSTTSPSGPPPKSGVNDLLDILGDVSSSAPG